MLAAVSRHDEALTHFEHIVNAQSETSGTDRVSYLIDMQWLADSISRANRRTEAAALLTRVVVGLRAGIGPDDERTMNATTALALVPAMDSEFERALSMQRPVLESLACPNTGGRSSGHCPGIVESCLLDPLGPPGG